MKNYRLQKVEKIYSGFFDYLKLSLCHTFLDSSNKMGQWSPMLEREVMSRGDAVAVLLYNLQKQEILFVEQFRAGALVSVNQHKDKKPEECWLLEPVAGCIDTGESPESAAKREAMEEAGVEIENLEPIAQYYPSPAACDEQIFLYAAQYDANHHFQQFGGLASENEDIAIRKMSFSEAKTALEMQKFCVSTTIMALQWFFANPKL